MKTVILYRSKHHGNTKKLVDAVAENFDNVDVIDVGVPVLSMHAPFEVVSKLDVYMAYRAFRAFYK